MKAVNLIPVEDRRGGGSAGRSGGLVYALLGALGVLLVAAVAYAMAGKAVSDRRAELADVTRKADAAQAQADDLRAYTRFSELSAKRVQTVTGLVSSRFDWAHTLREVSRVIPANSWLTGLNGNIGGATGATAPAAGSAAGPSVQITGCTTSQQAVARMMTRMRLIDGVATVDLASSTKGGCGNSEQFPAFQMTIAFRAPAPAASQSTATQGNTR